jgi:hypothetical protein
LTDPIIKLPAVGSSLIDPAPLELTTAGRCYTTQRDTMLVAGGRGFNSGMDGGLR